MNEHVQAATSDPLFNPLSPEYIRNPYPHYERLRTTDPMHLTPLGELRPALFGARDEQDHFHVKKRRTSEWILPAAIHRFQRIDKIRDGFVPGEKIEIAPDRLLDVILEHGDDQLVLALEIRIERAAGETGRSRDGLDAGAADALFLEHARRRFEQLVAGIVPGRSGSNS